MSILETSRSARTPLAAECRSPRVIPHSDGAGRVDRVGDGVPGEWLGRRVWCYGAQSYRPFGTAAEYTVVPASQVMPLPASVSMEQGACLGIPGITAHRSVHAGGPVAGRTLLIHGGAGAVGVCAVQLARRAGAFVIATVRSPDQEATARRAGAHHVIAGPDLVERLRSLAPGGVYHVVDVAFGANVAASVEALSSGVRSPRTPPTGRSRRSRSGRWSSRMSASASSGATTSRSTRRWPPPAN